MSSQNALNTVLIWHCISKIFRGRGSDEVSQGQIFSWIRPCPRSYLVLTDDGGNYRRNRRHLRKTMEPDDVEADIALPTKDQDLTDLHTPPAGEESVPHQPKDQATPKVAVRTSSRQTRRPAYLEHYVTET